MKFTTSAAAAAAFATAASAAKESTNWGVLRFNGKETTMGRIDPIVSPGKPAQHVHGAVGGSAFNLDSTGESMAKSKCTSAKVKEDKSAYWFPWLYFQDPESGDFEPVNIHYVNVYYFFEKSDDDIVAFPQGLQLVAGDANTRVDPGFEGALKIVADEEFGEVQPVQWTCPRDNNNFDSPPSWPSKSDGSSAGTRDPNNKGSGTGFPDVTCDGFASPLRADIHMPSCYNPKAGLTDYKNNSAYPVRASDGKVNCPKGWIHVPHMFYEVYWDTLKFQGRWTEDAGTQPFVLSNGDVTGYSSHADFLAAWDEDALQNLIDNCNGQHAGLHTCSGITVNQDNDCTNEQDNIVDEKVTGTLSKLPGDRPLEGWALGFVDKVNDVVDDILPGSKPTAASVQPAPVKTESPAETPVEAANDYEEAPEAEEVEQVEETPAPAPEPEPTPAGNRRVKTVWETVTVTATATAEASPGAAVRRHLHNHAQRHHGSHF